MAPWTIQIAINFDSVQLITPFIVIIRRLYHILKLSDVSYPKLRSPLSLTAEAYNLAFVIKKYLLLT